MLDQFLRTKLVFGAKAMEALSRSRVAVFGIGGVGGHVVEALARSGVGKLDIIDNDEVCLTNLNRQIFATLRTIGRPKVEVARERICDINPNCQVKTHKIFYTSQRDFEFDFEQFDYVIDAIDTVAGKLELVMNAVVSKTPIISSMGMGNKTDATALEICDIYNTSVCPLAKVMRYECRRRGIKKLKVVFSKEKPVQDAIEAKKYGAGRDVFGSTAFVPAVAGLIIAGEVVNDIIKMHT